MCQSLCALPASPVSGCGGLSQRMSERAVGWRYSTSECGCNCSYARGRRLTSCAPNSPLQDLIEQFERLLLVQTRARGTLYSTNSRVSSFAHLHYFYVPCPLSCALYSDESVSAQLTTLLVWSQQLLHEVMSSLNLLLN